MIKAQISLCLFLFLVILFLGALPLRAETSDPFSFDNGQWMSFEHYKENIKHGKATTTNIIQDTMPNKETPLTPPTTENNNQKTVTSVPSRPLNLPVLPGVNKGFDMQVNSTEDDRFQSGVQISNFDTTPKVELPDANWQNAGEAAKQHAHEQNEEGADTKTPVNVRMSFLPNPDVRPTPLIEKPKLDKIPSILMSEKKADLPKLSDDAAACAAVSSYKKKQLEAIQSDRKTLAALQAAIAQLGLQKELSFMAGANGSVDESSKTDTPNPIK